MRAVVFGAIGAILLSAPAHADEVAYRGYAAVLGDDIGKSARARLEASTRCQIDIVESVGLPAETTQFFRTLRFSIDASRGEGRYATGAGVLLRTKQLSDKTPVLLHEYLHAFHFERMPPEQRRQLLGFYGRARSAKLFPENSYMLTNPTEFFAMTASAYLYGRIQRDPFTRETVQHQMPVYYQWLGQVLGAPESALVAPRQANCG